MSEQIERDDYVTAVIFRAWKSGDFKGDVDAILPEDPAEDRPDSVMIFNAREGHSGGRYGVMMKVTRPATPEEYARTKEVMEKHYGYRLKVYRKRTAAHRREHERERQAWQRGG